MLEIDEWAQCLHYMVWQAMRSTDNNWVALQIIFISLVYFIKVPPFPSGGGGGSKKGLKPFFFVLKEAVCF